MKWLAYLFYYLIIYNLPHGRFFKPINTFRRYYICNIMGIAKYHKNTRIQNKVYLSGINKVTFGENCQINEYVFIQSAIIGSNVMIAPYTSILGNIKNIDRTDVPMNTQGWKEKDKKVIIEDDVWIGRSVIIFPGIKIHRGSIIGAGSIVTKDVAEFTVVAGSPAKVIKERK